MIRFAAAEAFIRRKLEAGLSPHLTYHGLHHTLDVLAVSGQIAASEGITEPDLTLLRTAAWYHDSGFLNVYSNHEAAGCELARHYLPRYGYQPEDLDVICGMIMATKIPQSPQTLLERILCDADLDYLGRSDFYPVGATLLAELGYYQNLHDEQQWNRIQVSFLGKHYYHTAFGKTQRAPMKQVRLDELTQLVAQYDAA